MTDVQQQRTTTRLSSRWRRRMLIFFVLFFGLGAWGLYDAALKYPARGRVVADWALYHYMEDLGSAVSRASVEDPAARLADLIDRGGERNELPPVEQAEYNWLTALSRVANLDVISRRNAADPDRQFTNDESPASEKRTTFENASEVHAALDARFASAENPNPLSTLDIPIQWAITLVGMVGAALVSLTFIRASLRTYRYEPDSHRLHFPDKRSATPEELEYIDKRKWDKFFVYVKIKGESDEIKLDLLKYEPLETWVLEMEKLRPGYEPDPEDDEAEGGERILDPDQTTEVDTGRLARGQND
ncbi:MAG: hypothetical protein KDA21_10490 [Phycisphaerales bacterium]|nr:hypothetical protein [Phycisphaerales bacterium]